MNNFDDLFESKKEQEEKKTYHPYNKDEWVEKKKQERASAFAMLDEATVEMMNDPEKFKDYLNVQSRFDRYSVSNAVLIAHQKPDATRIADFDTWKDDDISILKGEKAFTIFEPGKEFTREDGSTGFSVNVKKVFDISQTSEAENAPQRRTPDPRKVMKALIAATPCDIRMTDELPGNVDAKYVEKDNAIYVRQGMEGDDLFATLAQEIVSARIGKDAPAGAFVAYCSSYVLCERYGFSTDRYNFDNLPKYFEGQESKGFRNGLDRIREAANDISQDMSRNMEAQEKAQQNKSRDAR